MRVPRHKKTSPIDDEAGTAAARSEQDAVQAATGHAAYGRGPGHDDADGADDDDAAHGVDSDHEHAASTVGRLDDDLAARMRPSKTRLKKQMHDLQALGEALVQLPASRTATLDLSETLRFALRDYRQTKTHEGRRRQMQFIGKLMRHTDAEPIREAVAAMQLGSAKDTLALHKAERLRVQLIDSDDALTRWLEDHPQTDVQQMRSLIRAARKDAASAPEQRNGRAYRELFQLIKQHQNEDAGDRDERED
ncbi:hypothetical protein BH09PSE5_BH09PSE5_38070 [soil metagenome]